MALTLHEDRRPTATEVLLQFSEQSIHLQEASVREQESCLKIAFAVKVTAIREQDESS